VFGDGVAVGARYYSAIGDHGSPRGTTLLFEYDSTTRSLRMLVNVREFLESSGTLPPDMDYIPGKIHSRISMGRDGWLYYSTHPGHGGSGRTTDDAHGYRGDWILRTHPESGRTEIVAAQPIPKHSLPAGFLDPGRMIFYGGTAPGKNASGESVMFLAYDVNARRLVGSAVGGFERYAIFSTSTGAVYWEGKKYDPGTREITPSAAPHVRSATQETPDGLVYGTSHRDADLWAFDVKTEALTRLGPGAVGKHTYTTSMDADPSGRYLYYIPGMAQRGRGPLGVQGGAHDDGTPVVQYDVKLRKRKVIAFLHPFYRDRYGYTPAGTFSAALDPRGDKLYVTWNGMRDGSKAWESCALMVIHIPESERRP
jgi:hypothetical protein